MIGRFLFLIMLVLPASVFAADPSIMSSSPVDTHSVVIDPTKNVLDKVQDAVKRLDDLMSNLATRQDDLRVAGAKLQQANVDHTREVGELKSSHLRELMLAEFRRIDEGNKLREEKASELRTAEAKRLDAIRTVDVSSVDTATKNAAGTALTLQNQVNQSADALRTAGQRQTEELRSLITSTVGEVSKRVTTLEQAQSEGRGKQTYQDPQIAGLLEEVRKLNQQRADAGGISTGQAQVYGAIVIIIMILIGIGAILVQMRRRDS
jgi:hypothetical protein